MKFIQNANGSYSLEFAASDFPVVAAPAPTPTPTPSPSVPAISSGLSLKYIADFSQPLGGTQNGIAFTGFNTNPQSMMAIAPDPLNTSVNAIVANVDVNPATGYSWTEADMVFGVSLADVCISYDLEIPANFNYQPNTITPGANNNKFLAVYELPYQSPGFQINLSLEPNGAGGANLELHWYDAGAEQQPIPVMANFITATDYGKAMHLDVRVTPPSVGQANGRVTVAKNGTVVFNNTTLNAQGTGQNVMQACYFLGWDNACVPGVFVIRNVEVYA